MDTEKVVKKIYKELESDIINGIYKINTNRIIVREAIAIADQNRFS